MARPPNLEAPIRLLKAAQRIFARDGVDAARIQDITEEAGFSKAAFYLYFSSKDQAFEQLVSDLFVDLTAVNNGRHVEFQQLVERLGPCTEADYMAHSARLTAFAELDHAYNRKALEVTWEHRLTFAAVLDQAVGSRRAMTDRLVDISRATLVERLQEVTRAGFIRLDLDPELAAEMMIGAWLQLARRMCRLPEPPDLEAWAWAVDRFFSQGLGCAPGTLGAPFSQGDT